MAVFCPKSESVEQIFDVWSYEAQITFNGLETIDGSLADAEVSDTEGLPNLVEIAESAGSRSTVRTDRVVMIMTNGSTMTVSCSEATLELGQRHRWMETWSGPLWDEHSEQDVWRLP